MIFFVFKFTFIVEKLQILIYTKNKINGGEKMRIEVQVKANEIPVDYRMGTLSVIKEAISQSDKVYYERLFVNNKSPKPFAYAVYLKNFSYSGKVINLDGFNLTISSSNLEFMINLYNGLRRIKKYYYRNFLWQIEKISMLPEKTIHSSTVLFKTLSPILIESKEGKVVFPNDKIYEQEFNYYASLVIQACLGRTLKRPLSVKPLKMKKIVIKESNSNLRKGKNSSQVLYFTTFSGHLFVEGHQEDLMCLYQNGISKRRSLGLGMLEIEMEGVRE